MEEIDSLVRRFEEHRPRMRAVAFRLLGSTAEADDAVQEAWLRLSRSDPREIHNLEAWLVTVVGRVALNMLRTRRTRGEESLEAHLPELALAGQHSREVDPEGEALAAASVGTALLVVLETLTPAERLAYVLHDIFSVPFDEIGEVLGRSPAAARQLASRGRRRLRGLDPTVDRDAPADPEVVRAFLAAARDGDFEALLALLHPDVVRRAIGPGGSVTEIRGAEAVAARARAFALRDVEVRLVLVDGSPGLASYAGGRLFTAVRFTVADGLISAMDVLADPRSLAGLRLVRLDDGQ